MEISTDNPAGRLFSILHRAKGLSGDGYQVWGQVLNVPLSRDGNQLDDDSILKVSESVIELRKLVNEVELKIKSIDDINHSLYLTPFDRIRRSISLKSLNTGNYEVHLQAITEGDMTVLAFCSDLLSKYFREPAIEESQIEEILSKINELYSQVFTSSLEDEIKIFILDELEMLRRAIHEFRIRGYSRLKEAMPSVVGSYVITREWLDKREAGEEEKGLTDSFIDLLARYGTMVSFAANSTKLLEAASTHLPKLLPGG